MITPYRYRFVLGPNNPRTIENKHIIVYDGDRMEIDSNSVEFKSEKKLTWGEFLDKTKGTEGISGVYGSFEEDDIKYRSLITYYDLLVEELYKGDYSNWDTEQTIKKEIERLRKELGLEKSYAIKQERMGLRQKIAWYYFKEWCADWVPMILITGFIVYGIFFLQIGKYEGVS